MAEKPDLTTREAASFLGYSTGTLENLRIKGEGPPYRQRVDRGRVFYSETDLTAWRDRQVRTSTTREGR